MSGTKKSNQSGENLFSTSLEKELLELELLSADMRCSDTITKQEKSACEEEMSPPDDSALRSPPVFLKQEPLKAPVFPAKKKKNSFFERPDEDVSATEDKKTIQLPEPEEEQPSLPESFVNEQGTESLIEELKEVYKIAADSLSSQEVEGEETEEVQEESVKPEKKEPVSDKKEQASSESLLEELDTLQILSEIDKKKGKKKRSDEAEQVEAEEAEKPAETEETAEQGDAESDGASAQFLQELNSLSQGTVKGTAKKSDKKSRPKKEHKKFKDWTRKKKIVVASVTAGVLVFLIVLFQFVGFAVIDGASMTPSLSEHDFIIYWKHPGEIDREDVILSRASGYQNQIIAKRVVGLPGDIVQVDSQGKVILNGEPYSETKAIYGEAQIPGDVLFPVEVAQNCYFVLGDNRAVSVDSRVSMMGQVAEKDILGEVICWFHIE